MGSGFVAELDEKMSYTINKVAPDCRGRENGESCAVLNSTQALSAINHRTVGVSRGTTGVLKLLNTEELQEREPPALWLNQLLLREFLPQQEEFVIHTDKSLHSRAGTPCPKCGYLYFSEPDSHGH